VQQATVTAKGFDEIEHQLRLHRSQPAELPEIEADG
jgi:hypothetical protein